jgi:ABC-type multidrug transport system fused ATPase/permease subunit
MLRAALAEETENRTVLIVAQRISTIMHAEKIVVLEAGRIVGQGRHEDLLVTSPVYREIAASQLSEAELAMAGAPDAGGPQA